MPQLKIMTDVTGVILK